jgi:hypothetical protein
MEEKYYHWYLIEKAKIISSDNMIYKFFSITENNFYYSDFESNQSLILEVLPECILTFFIFYSLVNLFNDKTAVIFQYYK